MSDPVETIEEVEPKKDHPPASTRALHSPKATPVHQWADEEEEETFFKRHAIGLICGGAAVAIVVWFYFHPPVGKPEPVRKAPETVVRIQLPPPPPPPPPPKVQPPPPKVEKRVEQTPVDKPDPKPVAEKPKPAEKPPEGLGTSIKGGPGLAGLSNGSGSGMLGGTGSGKGGGGGSMGRWYVGQVISKVTDVMRNNPKTRSANLVVNARVWLDATGRIDRVELVDSSGDAAMDNVLKQEILMGTRLSEPPPQGMRMPIPLRLTARRQH
ncbi:MAG: TonB C-terminal domain-containing protein [Chthoniobacteraceae bacterium]